MKYYKAVVMKLDVDRTAPSFNPDIIISVNGSDPYFLVDGVEAIIPEDVKVGLEDAVEIRKVMPRGAKDGINLDNGEEFVEREFPRFSVKVIEELGEKEATAAIKKIQASKKK